MPVHKKTPSTPIFTYHPVRTRNGQAVSQGLLDLRHDFTHDGNLNVNLTLARRIPRPDAEPTP